MNKINDYYRFNNRVFLLEQQKFQQFMNLLNAPHKANQNLQKLLATKAVESREKRRRYRAKCRVKEEEIKKSVKGFERCSMRARERTVVSVARLKGVGISVTNPEFRTMKRKQGQKSWQERT